MKNETILAVSIQNMALYYRMCIHYIQYIQRDVGYTKAGTLEHNSHTHTCAHARTHTHFFQYSVIILRLKQILR